MQKYFLTTYRKTKGKIHRKLCILQKRDLYLNQFSNKKGAIGKPERPNQHPIWAAHPRTHLSTKYPPGAQITGLTISLTLVYRRGMVQYHPPLRIIFRPAKMLNTILSAANCGIILFGHFSAKNFTTLPFF